MAEPGQARVDAKELYFRLIKQLGLEAEDTQGNRLRQHPRFSFDSPERTVLLQVEDFSCALKDVSVGGLSFLSTYNFNIGRDLDLQIDGKFSVKAHVVRVVLEERDEKGDDRIYMHGCKFAREADGYRCTVLVLNLLVKLLRD